jgi:hypothetical protein
MVKRRTQGGLQPERTLPQGRNGNKKNRNSVDTISNDTCDLPSSRNQSLKSADDEGTKNIIKTQDVLDEGNQKD